MDKIQFYKKIQDIKLKKLKCYHTKLIHCNRKEDILFCRKQLKNINSIEVTYNKTNIMYNMLQSMNLEFDFSQDYIIIHYPEIKLSNHTIRDLYFMFVPIIHYDIGGLSTLAFRATYTYIEYFKRYLHPHIQFVDLGTISENICFGSTPFILNNEFEYNFIRFLLYLETYLHHEHPINPYIRTGSLSMPLELSENRFRIPSNECIDFSIFKMEFVNIKNGQYVSLKFDEDELEKYVSQFGNSIKTYIIDDVNELNGAKIEFIDSINKENRKITKYGTPIKFKNNLITVKILMNEKRIGYSETFRRQLLLQCVPYLTEKYMEAYSENFRTSNETEQVFMLENT